jgi:putative peptide zinc metalloprotease protein
MKSSETEAVFRASSSRPLPLRRRPDLAVSWTEHEGRRCAVVKDPLTLNYFRFDEEEFALFEMLDGKASLDDLRMAFVERFAPARISLGELQRFLGSLHRRGLLIVASAGQGERLAQRAEESARRGRLAIFANILCVRFRGVDPDRWLATLARRFGWLFTTPALLATMLFAFAALLLVLVRFDEVVQRLPQGAEFFAARNWLYLAATLAATKVAH